MDWKVGASLLIIQGYIGYGANTVEKNKQKIMGELTKILSRKDFISKDMYEEAKDLKDLLENGTSSAIIYSSLAGFVSRYHHNCR